MTLLHELQSKVTVTGTDGRSLPAPYSNRMIDPKFSPAPPGSPESSQLAKASPCDATDTPELASDSRWKRIRRSLTSPLRWPVRLATFYVGVALPLICHLITIDPNWHWAPPRWQSGALSDKLGFVLSFSCGWPVLPFLAIPMICLALVIFHESKFASIRIVRFGVYSGVPVSCWYALIFGLTLGEGNGIFGIFLYGIGSAVGIAACWVFLKALLWILKHLRINWVYVTALLIPLAILAWLKGAYQAATNAPTPAQFWEIFQRELITGPLEIPFGILLFSLLFSTSWCMLGYLAMSLRISMLYSTTSRFRMIELMGWTTWLSGFIAACRMSVILSLAEYSKLPVQDPGDCYVASAAALGPPQLVKSRPVHRANGKTTFVNHQLATLKAGELSLQASCPPIHRCLRCVYNRLGPFLARRIRCQSTASLAYLTLKPFEWITRLGLVCLLGTHATRWINRLYRCPPAEQERDKHPFVRNKNAR